MIDRLARVPAAVVAAALIIGALLADAHAFVLAPAVADTGAEPAQWTARIGIMLYWLILPLALLAVWARRRRALGTVGKGAAILITIQVPLYVLLTVAAVAWGLLLGRGDLGDTAMRVGDVGIGAFYLGVVVLAIRLLTAGRRTIVLGALLLGGFVASFIVPFGLTIALAAFAALFLVQEADDAPSPVPAH